MALMTSFSSTGCYTCCSYTNVSLYKECRLKFKNVTILPSKFLVGTTSFVNKRFLDAGTKSLPTWNPLWISLFSKCDSHNLDYFVNPGFPISFFHSSNFPTGMLNNDLSFSLSITPQRKQYWFLGIFSVHHAQERH